LRTTIFAQVAATPAVALLPTTDHSAGPHSAASRFAAVFRLHYRLQHGITSEQDAAKRQRLNVNPCEGVIPTDKGTRVRFRVSDVFLPNPEELLKALFGDTEMEGTIVDFSDSGAKRDAFAVVEVDSGQTWVVPAQKLKLATPGMPGSGD
jgi:hypothetical protein